MDFKFLHALIIIALGQLKQIFSQDNIQENEIRFKPGSKQGQKVFCKTTS